MAFVVRLGLHILAPVLTDFVCHWFGMNVKDTICIWRSKASWSASLQTVPLVCIIPPKNGCSRIKCRIIRLIPTRKSKRIHKLTIIYHQIPLRWIILTTRHRDYNLMLSHHSRYIWSPSESSKSAGQKYSEVIMKATVLWEGGGRWSLSGGEERRGWASSGCSQR